MPRSTSPIHQLRLPVHRNKPQSRAWGSRGKAPSYSLPLSRSDKIGDYEVLSLLGRGGMGEVYRAHDSRLKRDVAVKVLPAALALDPDRMGRFEREARLLASLNHLNIGAIYGLEESHDHGRWCSR